MEDAEMGLSLSNINTLAAQWDIEALDKLYDKYIENGTPEEKEKLAVEGYISVFSEMDYDFACGKLTKSGISLLLPMAEKASKLMRKPLYDVYSRVYMILLEDAIENHTAEVKQYFDEAEKAIQANIEESPEEEVEGYRQLALINDMLAEHRYFDREKWLLALDNIKKSVALDPVEGDWFFYMQLIYIPYQVRKCNRIAGLSDLNIKALYEEWAVLREEELVKFKSLAVSLDDASYAVALNIAMEFKRLKEHMEWYKMEADLFPENDYLHWIDEASQWKGQKTTRITLTEAGHFFHTEGKRYERIDLLEVAILHFQRLIDHIEGASFEVYYKASALEEISDIYFRRGEDQQGIKYRDQATSFYQDNMDLVKANPSVLMHYTEYLERCYVHSADIIKPSIDELKALTIITEDQGDGMYSAPLMLRIRLALLEKNEEEILYHIKKGLILFELSMKEHLESLIQMPEIKPFEELCKFIKTTLEFFKEIEENYYLDTSIKWSELKQMSSEEVAEAWEARKIELRNREKISWG